MSEALSLILVVWCLFLSSLAGRGFAFYWLLWQDERRWREASEFYQEEP